MIRTIAVILFLALYAGTQVQAGPGNEIRPEFPNRSFAGLKIQGSENPSGNVFGLSAGLAYGKLRTNDLDDPEFNFKPANTMSFGFSLEIPMHKLEEKGVFYNELSFSRFDAKSFVHLPDTSLGFPERDYYEISQRFTPNLITLTNMFRYCFVNNDFKYYISAGIYNSFVVSSVNSKTKTHVKDGETTVTEESAVPDDAIHGLMLIVGTGIIYKYVGLDFRFDPGRNYTNQVDYSIYNTNFSVTLNIRMNP